MLNAPQASSRSPASGQGGAVALLFSVVVLMVATLTTFVASRSTVMEQRLAANHTRARIAFEHAQAGLDYAARRFAGGVNVADTSTSISSAFATDNSNLADVVRVAFCAPQADDFSCANTPTDANPVQNCAPPSGEFLTRPFVVACGWSDDVSARQMVVQRLSGSPAFPTGAVNNPVTTPASAGMGGSFTVVNYFNNLTYWTGGNLEYGNATVKSFVRKPGTMPADYSTESGKADIYKSYQLAETLGDQCAIVKSGQDRVYNGQCKAPTNKDTTHLAQSTDKGSNANTIGADVVDKDVNLAGLSEAGFFRQFFGLDKTSYMNDITGQVLSPTEAASKLPDTFGEVVWVDGDLNLTGGPIGSLDRPVVLVIDGDLSLGAGVDFYGVLYVAGSMSGNANGNIYGAVLAYGGTTNLNGNPTIVYDETVVGNTRHIGRRTITPGTWRDWTIE